MAGIDGADVDVTTALNSDTDCILPSETPVA
jgi:hypothetical protein